MQQYFVNREAQANGDHEVHDSGCYYLSIMSYGNRESLGHFANCSSAVKEAKSRGYKANGCYFCSKPCHTG